MRDLTVAPGFELASVPASRDVVEFTEMPHQTGLFSDSDTLTSSPCDLVDTMKKVAVDRPQHGKGLEHEQL